MFSTHNPPLEWKSEIHAIDSSAAVTFPGLATRYGETDNNANNLGGDEDARERHSDGLSVGQAVQFVFDILIRVFNKDGLVTVVINDPHFLF